MLNSFWLKTKAEGSYYLPFATRFRVLPDFWRFSESFGGEISVLPDLRETLQILLFSKNYVKSTSVLVSKTLRSCFHEIFFK